MAESQETPSTPFQAAFIDHLKAKVKNHLCPACNTTNWMVGDRPLTMVLGPGFRLGGEHFPVAPLVCTNCGYVQLFNTVVVNLPIPERATEAPTETGTSEGDE